MVAACRQDMKQTNHCKLTMVWFENDISFLFVLLQSVLEESDHVIGLETQGFLVGSCDKRRDHVTFVLVSTRLLGGEP